MGFTIGVGSTVINAVPDEFWPFSVTVHVYNVVDDGETVMDGVVKAPGIHRYVALMAFVVAVKVTLLPEQIVELLEDMEIEGGKVFVYNAVISLCVSARFQIPMSSSLPDKN